MSSNEDRARLSSNEDMCTMSLSEDGDMATTARSITSWTKLGAATRDARLSLGMTQADAAAKAGVARSWLARVEAGHRGAEFESLLKLFAALDLELAIRPAQRWPEAERALTRRELRAREQAQDPPRSALERAGT